MHCVSICPTEARDLKGLLMKIGEKKLSIQCAGRKPNRLYL